MAPLNRSVSRVSVGGAVLKAAAVIGGCLLTGAVLWFLVVIPIRAWLHLREVMGFVRVEDLDPGCDMEALPFPGLVYQNPDLVAPNINDDLPTGSTMHSARGRPQDNWYTESWMGMSQPARDGEGPRTGSSVSPPGSTGSQPPRPLRPRSRIRTKSAMINAEPVNIESFPWTVALGHHFYWPAFWSQLPRDGHTSVRTMCTAVLIRSDWVLTSAHCVSHYGYKFYVTAGTDCRSEFGGILLPMTQIRKVRRVHFYHTHRWLGWSTTTQLPVVRFGWIKWAPMLQNVPYLTNDIALLQLETPFELSPFVQPIRPATASHLDRDMIDLNTTHVTGWGLLAQPNVHHEQIETTLLQGARFVSMPLTDVAAEQLDQLEGDSNVSGSLEDKAVLTAFLPKCLKELMCVRVRQGDPSVVHSDSGSPWVAKLRDTDGSQVDHWRLVAITRGAIIQNYKHLALEDQLQDELEDFYGRKWLNPSHVYDYGVRVPNDEKINWLRDVINRH